MLVAETDAAKMWCPWARMRWAKPRDEADVTEGWQPPHGDGSFNRTIQGHPNGPEHLVAKCVASACMAWRVQAIAIVGTERVLNGLAGYKTVTIREEVGFCGMAGAPPG